MRIKPVNGDKHGLYRDHQLNKEVYHEKIINRKTISWVCDNGNMYLNYLERIL